MLIFGESAGAGSTSCHLVMPKSWGKFTRALMQSGPIADWTAESLPNAEKKFDTIVSYTTCSGSSDIVACLRGLNSTELEAASRHNVPNHTSFTRLPPHNDLDDSNDPNNPNKLGSGCGRYGIVGLAVGFSHQRAVGRFTTTLQHNILLTHSLRDSFL